jgi:hypothetical protein
MKRYFIGAVSIALALGLSEPTSAQQMRAGLLTCDVSGGIGLIITSQKQVSCTFEAEQAGRQEDYDGTITKYGFDLGVTGGRRDDVGGAYRHGRRSGLPRRRLDIGLNFAVGEGPNEEKLRLTAPESPA